MTRKEVLFRLMRIKLIHYMENPFRVIPYETEDLILSEMLYNVDVGLLIENELVIKTMIERVSYNKLLHPTRIEEIKKVFYDVMHVSFSLSCKES